MSNSEKPADYYARSMLSPAFAQPHSDGTIEIGKHAQFHIRVTHDEAAELSDRLAKLSKRKPKTAGGMFYQVRIGKILLFFDHHEAKTMVRRINEAFKHIEN